MITTPPKAHNYHRERTDPSANLKGPQIRVACLEVTGH